MISLIYRNHQGIAASPVWPLVSPSRQTKVVQICLLDLDANDDSQLETDRPDVSDRLCVVCAEFNTERSICLDCCRDMGEQSRGHSRRGEVAQSI